MKKLTLFLIVILTVTLVFSGCGSKENAADTDTEKNSTEENVAKTEEDNKEEDTKKDKPQIAVLLWSRGFEFMVALDEGVQRKAEELGVDVVVLDGQSDSQVQIGQIEDNIAKQVDAIVLAPANSDELVPGVRKANEAGIPVVTVDGIVSEGPEIASSVAFDNAEAGRVAANYIIDQLGQGTVLECQGAQGAYHSRMRNKGFSEVMDSNSDFTVISKDASWLAEEAQNITADVITANPEVGAIYSHNDEMIRGIVSGLKQLGKLKKVGEEGHIMIVGIDGTPLALDKIRKGEQDATVQQNPFDMGAAAVQAAYDVINGKEVEKEIFLPPTLITKENVDNPELWGNQMK